MEEREPRQLPLLLDANAPEPGEIGSLEWLKAQPDAFIAGWITTPQEARDNLINATRQLFARWEEEEEQEGTTTETDEDHERPGDNRTEPHNDGTTPQIINHTKGPVTNDRHRHDQSGRTA